MVSVTLIGRGTGERTRVLPGAGACAGEHAAHMTTTPISAAVGHEPELLAQTVVLIGGSPGIGLETARRARRAGAEVVLAGRNAERLQRAAPDGGARRQKKKKNNKK